MYLLILLQTDKISMKETENERNFDQVNFVLNYFSTDWDDTFKISEENIDYSTEASLTKINNLLDCYAPFKKGLQKSISVKNESLTVYIKMKNHDKKLELHKKYKNHRNLLSTLIKQSKHKYFNKYFEDNCNNMKNTWKGIKNIITLNNFSSDVPRTLPVIDVTTSNPCDIANTFNNYFISIAKKSKEKINYFYKHYPEYLSGKCKNLFFIDPTNKDKIADIISSLDKNKSVGPYGVPNNLDSSKK